MSCWELSRSCLKQPSTHHATFLVVILTKAQRQIRQRLSAALHRHGLIVTESVLLHA